MTIPLYLLLEFAIIHIILIGVVGWGVLHSGNKISIWLDENIEFRDIYLELDIEEVQSFNY